MIQGLGTSWMIGEPTDTPIEKMSFEEVKAYMCPKSHGSTIACGSCGGFKTCPAGQRAVRLVGERQSVEDEREEFRKACESGNAREYLMKSREIGKNAAADLLSRLVKKYPGISADYGGSRRIIRNCTIKKEEPEKQPEDKPEDKPLTKAEKGGAVIREKAREEAKAAMESGDPVRYLMETTGATYKNARFRVCRWIRLYPDIVGDYRPEDKRRKKAEEPKTEKPQEEQQVEFALEDTDDTVSLADFLNEFETEAQEEPKEPEDPKAEPLHFSDLNLGEYAAPENMLVNMQAKRNYFHDETERLRKIVLEAEEKIRWYEEQDAAMEKVMAIFRADIR